VRKGVSKETAQKQVPWESSSLLGDFYFKGDATAVAPAATADSGIAAEYAAYLKSYPQGRFAARQRAGRYNQVQRRTLACATRLGREGL
jgi:hypothetical protein